MSAATAPGTRSQQLMRQALADVREVERAFGPRSETATAYGGLCHTLPVLVRTHGLCQTLALIEDKAGGGGPSEQAYATLRQHIAGLLGIASSHELLSTVADAPLTAYLFQTRLVLDAWVYYKRFAVSLLNVESGQERDEG